MAFGPTERVAHTAETSPDLGGRFTSANGIVSFQVCVGQNGIFVRGSLVARVPRETSSSETVRGRKRFSVVNIANVVTAI